MKKKVAEIIILICLGAVANLYTEQAYDLNGEWNVVYNNDLFRIDNDIVYITQKGHKFVGIKTIGKRWIDNQH